MKGSYKIALLVAAGLLAIVLGYYLTQGDPLPDEPLDETRLVGVPGAEPGADAGGDDGAPPSMSAVDRTGPRPPAAAPPTGDAFLDGLRASVSAARTPPTQDAPPTPGEPVDSGDDAIAPPPADAPAAPTPPAPPAGDEPVADTRANGALSVEPDAPAAVDAGANPGTPVGTVAAAPPTSPTPPSATPPAPAGTTPPPAAPSPTASATPAPRPAATTTGPDFERPYFGPLPDEGRAAPTPPNTPATARAAADGGAAGAARAGGQGGEYTIKAGDTFARIAANLYGDERRWVDIAQANPLVDPTRLRVGQTIRLPGAEGARRAARRDAVEQGGGGVGEGVTYTIRAGDTLSSIAQQHYGDPGAWRTIYEANRGVIRNPDRITGGVEIRIPPAPRGAQ